MWETSVSPPWRSIRNAVQWGCSPITCLKTTYDVKLDLEGIEWGCGLDWIILAEDGDRWRALVNTVMDVGGSIKSGDFLSS